MSVSHSSQRNFSGPPLFFIMMRLNYKFLLCLLCLIVIFLTSTLWNSCVNKEWKNQNTHICLGESGKSSGHDIEGIECTINGDYSVDCRKEGDEVYVPFTFLQKYFEVYGKLTSNDDKSRFEWSHSYSKIYQPKGRYDPRGVFMHFENYNVEIRERVKCVSGIEGVPMSTQWESQGYYYPTQIAQFGLAHYSKNLTEPEPRRKVVENADKELGKWTVPLGASLTRTYLTVFETNVLNFSTDAYTNGIKLKMDHVLDFVMSLNILLQANSSLTVVLQNRENKENYNLHYISSDVHISLQNNNIYHGIGIIAKWKRITRDLIIDFQKGISYLEKDKSKNKVSRSKLKVVNIILRGKGAIDNLTLSSSEHILQFYDSADWFVRNQDPNTGGWQIPVKRKLASGFQDLKPGWYSAMGQGQAMSVLSRAYHHSGGDVKYLKAALAALKPFRIPSAHGGVLATFLSKYHWYEEYPTKPSSFVLNGFIYSLLGLYDLMTITPPNYVKEAELLFNDGMVSLKNMLPLFDMGSTTSYDLRHFTLGIAPNLARWDYHATHINQLLLLSTIDNEPLFAQTADRWRGYMSGKRAAHN
ncbi:D-glucuronyl C5-epimerase B isoform X2 [Onthophagus taurus]|uniref:D-glucuronyl C5-epimerase B isoform X2 n=1 Tax=Onthophagus taurus TaxID=166361 RepID=UPI0039BE8FCF